MNMIFGDKKILNANFSIDEMNSIEDPAEARKYMIAKYFFPVVYTYWQEYPSKEDWMLFHITYSKDTNGNKIYVPSITAAKEENNTIKFSNRDIFYSEQVPFTDYIRRAVGDIKVVELSSAIARVFEECFPADFNDTFLNKMPLVASIQKIRSSADANKFEVKLHNLVKIRSKVKKENILLLQIHKKTAYDVYQISTKYNRPYNALTGEWQGLCPTPLECPECKLVVNETGQTNAYDDMN